MKGGTGETPKAEAGGLKGGELGWGSWGGTFRDTKWLFMAFQKLLAMHCRTAYFYSDYFPPTFRGESKTRYSHVPVAALLSMLLHMHTVLGVGCRLTRKLARSIASCDFLQSFHR